MWANLMADAPIEICAFEHYNEAIEWLRDGIKR
jgi:hypothetical protein